MSKVDLKPISTGDIATMRRLREEGLTNKKIAERMGISVSSVYRHIGRKSQDVKYAEVQNKPSPVKTEFKFDSNTLMVVHDIDIPVEEEVKEEKPVITETTVETETTIDVSVEEKEEETAMESSNLLQVLSTRMVLKGSLCNFIVDTESGTIEMNEGTMSGILDRDTVDRFIAELTEIRIRMAKEDRK